MPAHGRIPAVHVVGAGGIGCAVGYALLAAGAEVVFVDADSEKVRYGNVKGVGVESHGSRTARFVEFTDWQPDAKAIVLLCTKCFDNARVIAKLPNEENLIPIQNGFDPELDKRKHLVEGVASFVSECLPSRPVTRITRAGKLHIGYRRQPASYDPPDLANRLRRCKLFSVQFREDILPYKYTKLMYNAAISPLAAAAGLDNSGLLAVPKTRRLFFALLNENYSILHGAGIPLGKIGPFHPDLVAKILRRPWLAGAMGWAFYPTLRGTYCSMARDLPAGPTEADYYNGHLIRLAGDRPCPLNRKVCDLVKRMECQRIQPALNVLDELG